MKSLTDMKYPLAVDLKGTLHPFALSFVSVIFLNGHGLFPYFPLRWEK